MGRGAAVNGNGHPVLPPGALSPITIYRQPEPARRGIWAVVGAVVAWMFIALLMAAGAIGGGYYLFLEQRVEDLVATTPDVVIAQKQLDIPLANEPATALVIGYDKREDEAAAAQSRSDTVMLVRADPNTESISLLSFPRDLIVDVTCHGRPTYRGRINEAYSECGSTGTLQTVRKLTGVSIHYLVTVDFRGFRQVVNSVDGVWLDIDRRYFNDRSGPFGYATINLQPGYQKLNGYQALDFVRFRHTDSDLYRVARQQMFVRSLKSRIKEQLSGTSLALTVPKLVSAVTKNVEVGRGGGKKVDIDLLRSYALFAYGLPPGHIFQSSIDGLEGFAELTTSEENIRAAIQEFAHPDVESPDKATAVALNEKPKKRAVKAPPPRDTTITVLNGNGVTGAAANGSYLLGQRGYAMLGPPDGLSADAPTFDYFKTEIHYDAAQAGSKPAAQKVAALFGTQEIVAGQGADRGALQRRHAVRRRRQHLPRHARRGAGRQDAEEGAARGLARRRRRAAVSPRARLEGAVQADGADRDRPGQLDRPRAAGADVLDRRGRAEAQDDPPHVQPRHRRVLGRPDDRLAGRAGVL